MKRLQLFEFDDQPWMPRILREIFMDCLTFGYRVGGHYRNMHRPFSEWARLAGIERVLDLASGGGAPAQLMLQNAERDRLRMPELVLSDLFPNLDHYRALQQQFGADRVTYIEQPVSVFDLSGREVPACSMCSALHHFGPEQARRILREMTRNRDGFFVMDLLQRDWKHLSLVLVSGPWFFMLAPFFIRPFSWSRLLYCTLLPVVPLMIFFDGCVSVLRSYKPEEIRAMLPADVLETFEIVDGTQPYQGVLRAGFVYGYRKRSAPHPAATGEPEAITND